LYKANYTNQTQIYTIYLFYSKGIFLPNLRYYSSSFFIKAMRKSLLCILFLLLSSAQNSGDVVIEWNKKQKCILEAKLLTSLNLMDKLTYMTLSNRAIFYTNKISLNFSESYSVLSNVVYENISTAELGDLPIENHQRPTSKFKN
jgi:hypothetical protein